MCTLFNIVTRLRRTRIKKNPYGIGIKRRYDVSERVNVIGSSRLYTRDRAFHNRTLLL